MHCCAVFSQIFAHVPRPLINAQKLHLLYEAISALSTCFLDYSEEMQSFKDASNESPQLKLLPKLDDEWVIVSKNVSILLLLLYKIHNKEDMQNSNVTIHDI